MTAMKDLRYGILNELYGGLISPRQREIISNYYDYDLSLSEIADNSGTSRQAVMDALKKGESILDRFEAEINFLEKINKIRTGLKLAVTQLDENNYDEAKITLGDLQKIF